MSDRENRENLFEKLTRKHQPQPASPPAPSEDIVAKKRRPPVGKQRNPYWRSQSYYYYYIQGETELDVASELLELRREGLEIDKSDLADALLAAWVRWRQGEDIEPHLLEISPRRPTDG